MKRTRRLGNQSGQMIVEAILIITMLMGVTFLVAKTFKDQELIKGMITTPWQSLSGMLQNGVWGPIAKTNLSHPTAHGRHIVIEGEKGK